MAVFVEEVLLFFFRFLFLLRVVRVVFVLFVLCRVGVLSLRCVKVERKDFCCQFFLKRSFGEGREAPPFSLFQTKRKDREEIDRYIDHAQPKFLYGKKKKGVINVVFHDYEAFPSRTRKEKNDFHRAPCSF